ncbi:MAG: hypothetical protein LIR50_04920 [Bacillota bacterium]|nr:hypothetical protein [Bacillota bacterium]
MEIQGWNIDIDSLPGPNREEWPWMQDKLFENKQGDTACLIYSIAEVRMCWYAGRLAILQNKSKPEVILNPEKVFVNGLNDMVQYSTDGKYIYIKIMAYLSKGNKLEIPICIINLNERVFSFIGIINGCHYTIDDLGGEKIKLKDNYFDQSFEPKDGKIINLLNLEWFNILEIDRFIDIYYADKDRNRV